MRKQRQFAVGVVLGLTAASVFAQPAKPVRIVVAFPAGGPIDIVARMLSPKLSERWRSSLSSIIAAARMASLAPTMWRSHHPTVIR